MWLLRALTSSAGGIGDARYLAVNVFAKVIPDFLGHLEKHADHFRIELPPGPLLDLGFRSVKGLPRTIGTIGHDGIEGIRDRKDARSERDLSALQTARIAGAVVTLLMRINDFAGLGQKRNLFDDLITLVAVLLHGSDFFSRQLPWF